MSDTKARSRATESMGSDAATPPVPGSPCWWTSRPIASGTTGQWRIGPLHLWVRRHRSEWRIAFEVDLDAPEHETDFSILDEPPDLWGHPTLTRHVLSTDGNEVTLQPALADRPVVARPDHPIHVAESEDVVLYVTSPLWVRVLADNVELLRLPVILPPETWFGSSPRDGEVCYASRTTARLYVDKSTYLPHRAVTAVHVENHSTLDMPVSQIKLPVPLLALYVDDEGTLWTQDVVFERLDRDATSPLRLRKGPPAHAPHAVLITPARETMPERNVVQTLGSWILGEGESTG